MVTQSLIFRLIKIAGVLALLVAVRLAGALSVLVLVVGVLVKIQKVLVVHSGGVFVGLLHDLLTVLRDSALDSICGGVFALFILIFGRIFTRLPGISVLGLILLGIFKLVGIVLGVFRV